MNVPGSRKTNQGDVGRIRAPWDEPGPSRTKEGPHAGFFFKEWTKSEEFLILGVPWAWALSPGGPHPKENPATAHVSPTVN